MLPDVVDYRVFCSMINTFGWLISFKPKHHASLCGDVTATSSPMIGNSKWLFQF